MSRRFEVEETSGKDFIFTNFQSVSPARPHVALLDKIASTAGKVEL